VYRCGANVSFGDMFSCDVEIMLVYIMVDDIGEDNDARFVYVIPLKNIMFRDTEDDDIGRYTGKLPETSV